MELQKIRVYRYELDDEEVCALWCLKKSLWDETVCGLKIYNRISDNDEPTNYYDAIDEPFSGGYDNIGCCDCRHEIDRFMEQTIGGFELQKMKSSNGEERVCAVRYTPAEDFREETVCGIGYITDEKVAAWIADRFGEEWLSDNKQPTPIGKSFEGRYSDITCQECRGVIEYYKKPETRKA